MAVISMLLFPTGTLRRLNLPFSSVTAPITESKPLIRTVAPGIEDWDILSTTVPRTVCVWVKQVLTIRHSNPDTKNFVDF
ncbi:hypothetical protein D3C86_1349570 [compost metagenome]